MDFTWVAEADWVHIAHGTVLELGGIILIQRRTSILWCLVLASRSLYIRVQQSKAHQNDKICSCCGKDILPDCAVLLAPIFYHRM